MAMPPDPVISERDTRPMHVASRTKQVLGGDIIKTSTLMIEKCVMT